MPEYISSKEAHREILRAGIEISYPTLLKWLRDKNLAEQPTGKYGAILVDKAKLLQAIKERKADAA